MNNHNQQSVLCRWSQSPNSAPLQLIIALHTRNFIQLLIGFHPRRCLFNCGTEVCLCEFSNSHHLNVWGAFFLHWTQQSLQLSSVFKYICGRAIASFRDLDTAPSHDCFLSFQQAIIIIFNRMLVHFLKLLESQIWHHLLWVKLHDACQWEILHCWGHQSSKICRHMFLRCRNLNNSALLSFLGCRTFDFFCNCPLFDFFCNFQKEYEYGTRTLDLDIYIYIYVHIHYIYICACVHNKPPNKLVLGPWPYNYTALTLWMFWRCW